MSSKIAIKLKQQYQSIDEQIVPAKTRFSEIRQYNPAKN